MTVADHVQLRDPCGSGEDRSFLLVEDNDDHARLVEQMLRRGRFAKTIRRAADGAEALALLRRTDPEARRPDLILLDLNLPKVDGLEVLRQIKSDPALRSIPVVMMTSSDAESDRALAYDSYVNSYVLKPTDLGQFRRLVEDLTCYWTDWNRPAPTN